VVIERRPAMIEIIVRLPGFRLRLRVVWLKDRK
jgi:hypothetical protein